MASVGKVLNHTLTEDGNVNFYDVQWEDTVEQNIPANELVMVEGKKHKH